MSDRRRKYVMWLIVVFVALVVLISSVVLRIPPENLMSEAREWSRIAQKVHLVRIAVFSAAILFGWRAISVVVAKWAEIETETVVGAKWRVFAWYLAFEGAMLINFVRV